MRLSCRLFNSLRKGSGNDFTVMKANQNDRKEILRLMTIFFRSDPSSVYSKVANNPQLSPVTEELSVDSLEEGMSFVAKDRGNDKAALGIVLNGVRPTTLKPTYMESALKKVENKSERTLLELWSYVSVMPPDAENFFEGEKDVFEIRYLVVDPSQRDRGVATALVKSSIDEAADKGYKFVRIDCTSHFSARIASAAGLTCIYEMNYLDYKNSKGEQVFQTVTLPHDKIRIYAGKSYQ